MFPKTFPETKQPLPNRILHLCSKTTIWNGLKNCLVLAILTSSIQGVYTEGEDSMIKTELLKVFFVFFFLLKMELFSTTCFVLQFGRPTLWPARPITPLLDKRGLTPVSVSIPRPWGQSPLQASLGTDGWLLWNPQVHTHHHFQRMLWVCCRLCCYKCSVHVCLVALLDKSYEKCYENAIPKHMKR